jgi:hypothetical protein
MNTMPEVAMTVIEPGGRRWAQLLNVTWAVRELLPEIVARLDLPQGINYELSHIRSARVLRPGDSLQSAGIVAGEELQIKPVRDKLFFDLMDALYGEAVGYVAKQLWGQAEARLETLFRLDPQHPDPQGLRDKLARFPTPTGYSAGEPAASAPARAPVSSGPPATPISGPSPAAGLPPAPSAPLPAAAKKPRSACAIVAVLLGGLVLLFVVLAVGGAAWLFLRSDDNAGSGVVPTIEGEPALGTGDVQVILRWDNTADLDLHVVDPAGEEIYFSIPTSSSGGQLDVDANGDCSGDPPVENVFWPTGGAPNGNYQVSVVYYGSCDATEPAHYEVTTLLDGQVVDVSSGTLSSPGESNLIGNFSR